MEYLACDAQGEIGCQVGWVARSLQRAFFICTELYFDFVTWLLYLSTLQGVDEAFSFEIH